MFASYRLVRAGAQSATFQFFAPVPADPGDLAALRQEAWAELPAGDLRNLMTRIYATPEGGADEAAFISAQAASGLVVTSGPAPGTSFEMTLSTSGTSGIPVLSATFPFGASSIYVKLAVNYSASE